MELKSLAEVDLREAIGPINRAVTGHYLPLAFAPNPAHQQHSLPRLVAIAKDRARLFKAAEEAASIGIPVIALIGNDAGWTQIRRGQVDLYGTERAVATALDYTRYEKIVEACGGKGFWVETIEQLGPALDEAFASKVPACINVKIAKSDFRKGAISV